MTLGTFIRVRTSLVQRRGRFGMKAATVPGQFCSLWLKWLECWRVPANASCRGLDGVRRERARCPIENEERQDHPRSLLLRQPMPAPALLGNKIAGRERRDGEVRLQGDRSLREAERRSEGDSSETGADEKTAERDPQFDKSSSTR